MGLYLDDPLEELGPVGIVLVVIVVGVGLGEDPEEGLLLLQDTDKLRLGLGVTGVVQDLALVAALVVKAGRADGDGLCVQGNRKKRKRKVSN